MTTNRQVCLVATLFVLTAAAMPGARAPENWTLESPSAHPPGLSAPSMAYDAARRNVVLFGGWNGGDYSNQTWVWDGDTWTRQSPATAPVKRYLASITYDDARGEVVLFGGWTWGTYLNDTWVWDGVTWTQRMTAPPSTPPAGAGGMMAYDKEHGETVLLTGQPYNQTWVWDGANWTQRFPVHSPFAREQSSLAYDPIHKNIVLFGGIRFGGGGLGDTWTWDGTDWTEHVVDPNPGVRGYGPMLAFDGARVIQFGGTDIAGNLPDATWAWDGTAWTQLFPASHPPGHSNAAMAYDAARGEIVMFGGGWAPTPETWTWSSGLPPADTTAPDLLLPTLVPVEAQSPDGAPVTFEASAFDEVDGALPIECDRGSGETFPIGSTEVHCSAEDAAGNRRDGQFSIVVQDTTQPTVAFTDLSPDSNRAFDQTPAFVQIAATDAVGILSADINDKTATPAGTPQSGAWSALVPITLPVPSGGALTFTATVADAAGNTRQASVVVDNDGIPGALDRQPFTGADQSLFFSSDYIKDGTTYGYVSHNGWTVRMTDGPRLQASISGGGAKSAAIGACGGTFKEIRLNASGETAAWNCTGTTLTTTSVSGSIEVWKRSCFISCKWQKAQLLQPGTTFSTGSPMTADPANPVVVPVEILDDDLNLLATFLLEPGASADVAVEGGASDPVIVVTVLNGTISATIFGRTVTLAPGTTTTFANDTTPPVISGVSLSTAALWPANHQMVDVTLDYSVADARDPSPVCTLAVTSSEPTNGTGDGDTAPDWQVIDAHRLRLRAERAGSGNGRTYTVTVRCVDVSGNRSTAQGVVRVPKSQGK